MDNAHQIMQLCQELEFWIGTVFLIMIWPHPVTCGLRLSFISYIKHSSNIFQLVPSPTTNQSRIGGSNNSARFLIFIGYFAYCLLYLPYLGYEGQNSALHHHHLFLQCECYFLFLLLQPLILLEGQFFLQGQFLSS